MKRILSSILAVALVLSLVAPGIFVSASAATGVQGDGTKENPYIIKNEADFSVLDQSEEYIYAELANDIELTSGGETITDFRGELDGNGHVITNSKSGPFIKTYYEGKLSDFTWNMEKFQYMVEEQERAGEHVYEGLTATGGNVAPTSNNNNEAPLLVYAVGDTVMRNITLDMQFNSPTYHGLLIGYEPVKGSDYTFENCTLKGTYTGSDLGVLFGNGSMAKDSDYGFQHVLGVNGSEKTSQITVNNLNLTEAKIYGTKSQPKVACGVSYKEDIFGNLEGDLKTKTTGYENLKLLGNLEGYTFGMNKDGNLKISGSDTAGNVDHFVVTSEVYSNVFKNGVSDGTMKHAVSERIDVMDGVDEYYSDLGKVKFYDGKQGEYDTTGVNGSLKTITVDSGTYYALGEFRDSIMTFGETAEYSNTSRVASSVKVMAYDSNGNIVGALEQNEGTEEFTKPVFDEKTAKEGSSLSTIELEEGWNWVSPETEVVSGGQIAFAVKDNTVAPVSIEGEAVDVVSVDGVYYSSLQEAFDSLKTDEPAEVVLEKDIKMGTDDIATLAEGKEIVLNLNGHKISVTADFKGRPVVNKGTMTVTGDGIIDASASASGGFGALDNYGVMEIENGTFTGALSANGAAVRNRGGATLSISDGLFNGATTALYNEGQSFVYNGTFDGCSCSACGGPWGYTIRNNKDDNSEYDPVMYFYNGKVTGVQGAFSSSAGYAAIYGGEFETVACPKHPNGSSAFYALYVAGETGEVKAEIYGGTFTSATKAAAYIGNSNDGGDKEKAIAYFYDGYFKGGNGAKETIHVDNAIGGLEITGGTYVDYNNNKSDIKQYIPEGTQLEQDENGTVIHSHELIHVDAKDATCTQGGNIEYWYCEECNEYYRNAEGTDIVPEDEITIDATGHKPETVGAKDATCTEKGYTGDQVCSVCGDVIEKGEEVDMIPHDYQDGKCTVCGAEDPDFIPGDGGNTGDSDKPSKPEKPADSDNPQTGDPADIEFLAATLVISSLMLVAIFIFSRKKSRR